MSDNLKDALKLADLSDPFRQYEPAPESVIGILVREADAIRAMAARIAELEAKLQAVREWNSSEWTGKIIYSSLDAILDGKETS